jgi:hypothetical protein
MTPSMQLLLDTQHGIYYVRLLHYLPCVILKS